MADCHLSLLTADCDLPLSLFLLLLPIATGDLIDVPLRLIFGFSSRAPALITIGL
jgi:hypothetical protein